MFFKKASHLLIMPFFIIQSWKGLFSVPCVCEQQRDGGEGHEDADGDAGEEGAECGGVVANTLVVQTYFMSLEDCRLVWLVPCHWLLLKASQL